MKKRMISFAVLALVSIFFLAVVVNVFSDRNGAADVKASEGERDINNVLQMPCDGFAYNVFRDYAVEEGTSVKSLEFPKVEGSDEIDMEQIRNDVKEYLANYLDDTRVGRVFFNVNMPRSAIPSDVFDTSAYNVNLQEDGTVADNTKTYIEKSEQFKDMQYFWYALNNDIDIIGMGIDYVNQDVGNVETWASVRMNDHHFAGDPTVACAFRMTYASVWGVTGRTSNMDYTLEPVQTVYLNYIKEIVTNYDIDGIELDFLRTAPYMSVVNEENIQILNAFVKRVKTEINEIRPNMKVAVRVYATEEINLEYGLDIAQWVAEGSVDVVTVANFYIPTSFDLPIEEWRQSIDERNSQKNEYAILAGLDWGVKANPHYYLATTPAHTRGFVSAAYANGADGVLLFNMFYLDGYFATEYTISADGALTSENIFKERMLASDSLEKAEAGLRRYTYGYFTTEAEAWSTIPRKLLGYSSTSFEMQTGTAPEKGYYMVAIGLDDSFAGYDEDNLVVTLNGKPLMQIGDMPRNSSMYVVDTTSEFQAKHLTQVAQRFVQFVATDLNDIQDGYNVINVVNKSKNTQNILWVEVFVDGTDGATPVVAK